MELGQRIIRNQAAIAQSVELEELGKGMLINMPGFNKCIPGLHAVARDNRGFIIGIARVNLSAEEEKNFDQLKSTIQLDAEQLFGIS